MLCFCVAKIVERGAYMGQSEEKKKIRIRELQGWQKKKLAIGFFTILIIGIVYISYTTVTLFQDKMAEDRYWDSNLNQSQELVDKAMAKSANAVQVSVGSYIESMKEINLKSSSYRVVAQIWFSWEGSEDVDMANHFHVYNGTMNKKDIIKEYHKDGKNYQLLRCDITVSKDYWTVRFPLESHQLRFYVESEYPIEEVSFVADKENSGTNGRMSVSGFELVRNDVGVFFAQYDNTHADPELKEPITTAEFVTAMEFNRSSWGLYVKCFVALVGTITWVLIALFLCTYHRVDPLGMVPAALFGTVTNIMVGANLLPDALQLGLLEYVNAWGIMTILAVTIAIININRIRNKYEDREFAGFFGRVMFYTILCLTLTGHILMPVCAYMF